MQQSSEWYSILNISILNTHFGDIDRVQMYAAVFLLIALARFILLSVNAQRHDIHPT